MDEDRGDSSNEGVDVDSDIPLDGVISHMETDEATARSKKKTRKSANSLFIRSLAPTITTESLTEFFSQFFPIKHATVVVDPETKHSRGYGFVSFADKEDAERAREELDGAQLEGQKIKVEIAEPRSRDQDISREVEYGDTTSKASRREQALEARKSPKLIIRNLPWSIKTPEQLSALFRSYGKIKVATMPPMKKGLSAGFGFVILRGRKNAEKALAGINGKVVDGRTLAVDWAVDRATWQTVKTDETEQETNKPVAVGETDSVKSEEEKETDMEDIPPSDAENLQVTGNDQDSDEEDDVAPEKDSSTTLFIRNLPFESTDESLFELFRSFGPIRYARIVSDPSTGRSRGSAFVSFYNTEDAVSCLRAAPKQNPASSQANGTKKGPTAALNKPSLLENPQIDPGGRYTLDGRILHVTRAVDRGEAVRLAAEGHSLRDAREKDKRRFYLLAEGTVPSTSPLYAMLEPTELRMREDSAKQRQALMKSNPSLHLSLTRLSVRNIPRHVTSKDLKALAREAVVGFAKEVKEQKRQPLSREELARGGEAMKETEKERKRKGRGVVKQAKIVFEGKEGNKVSEESGAGRSRGYGFIEFYSHRLALMGLRWLNGHAIVPPKFANDANLDDRRRRLIVEFAIENAQVVTRRQDRESKSRQKKPMPSVESSLRTATGTNESQSADSGQTPARLATSRKRKRDSFDPSLATTMQTAATQPDIDDSQEKLVERQRIIGRKRAVRRRKRPS